MVARVEPSCSDPRLDEIVRRLVAAYAPSRVYLFGSRARGDSGPNSDYDVMLVVPDGATADRLSTRAAWEALRGIDAPVDVLVWPAADFERRLAVRASLPTTVVREGRLLHVA